MRATPKEKERELTSTSENNVRVVCYIEWCNERVNTGDTSIRATWHAPESRGVAGESEGGDGGLHIDEIAPGAGDGK